MNHHPSRSCRNTRGRALLLACAVGLAACGTDSDYLPLEQGRWQYFHVTDTILDEPRTRRFLSADLGRRTLNGTNVHALAMQSRSIDFLREQGAGVVRVATLRPTRNGMRLQETPQVLLPERAEAGQSWTAVSTLALIESRTFARRDRLIPQRLEVEIKKSVVALDDEVTVTGGRFAGCLRVEGHGARMVKTDRGNSVAEVTVVVREWYAPGIGLVLLEREELSDSTFLKPGRQRWELVDYGG